jgi:ferredoxin
MAAKIKIEQCKGCGACEAVCPSEAIVLQRGKAVVGEESCIECGTCIEYCQKEAISLPGPDTQG